MTRDWPRLAGAIKARRDALGLTQRQLAAVVGVTDTTIRNLEGGRREFSRLPSSLAPLEDALGWTRGSAVAVLNGGEPTLINSRETATSVGEQLPPLADRLPSRIVHELQGGEIFDTWVYDLSQDGGDGIRIVAVAIRDHDDPPGPVDFAKRRRDARIWEQAQRRLRGIKPLPWEPGDPEPKPADSTA